MTWWPGRASRSGRPCRCMVARNGGPRPRSCGTRRRSPRGRTGPAGRLRGQVRCGCGRGSPRPCEVGPVAGGGGRVARGAVGVVPTHGWRTRPTGGRSATARMPARSPAAAGARRVRRGAPRSSHRRTAAGGAGHRDRVGERLGDLVAGGGGAGHRVPTVEVVTPPVRATATQYVVPGFVQTRASARRPRRRSRRRGRSRAPAAGRARQPAYQPSGGAEGLLRGRPHRLGDLDGLHRARGAGSPAARRSAPAWRSVPGVGEAGSAGRPR